ncbi:MAG TPA: isocitrate dehydrogenase kinase/phosphatase AceK regulatory subunit, partial [Longimicrobiaceae bacterium]|nr:isocitrate dehydrogenase kinase/phosphatase AceK regulatory subunit [Longimicrobiaceae bacterium]
MPRADASEAADAVLAAYESWAADFRAVTRRAPGHFLSRDWHGVQRDAVERLMLYPAAVDDCVDLLRGRLSLGDARAAREGFAARVQGRADAELARTFFSSVVRRVLGTVGVEPGTEFTGDGGGEAPGPAAFDAYPSPDGVSPALFEAAFRATELADAFADLPGDAVRCARAAREQLGADADRVRAAEFLPTLFFRNKGAYLVGRLRLEGGG